MECGETVPVSVVVVVVVYYSTLNVFPCSGIGLALCERLLSQDTEGLQLCLACRNMRRAQAARSALLASHPTAQVALLQMDTSSVSSVITAAQEVKLRWEDRLPAAWQSNPHSHTQIVINTEQVVLLDIMFCVCNTAEYM